MAKQRKTPKTTQKEEINEGNLFDKILKENAEDIFLPLVEEKLGIKIKSFQSLKEKIQTTIEREMDFFYLVETEDGKQFILHLEFQTEDDLEMLYRKGEYHGISLRKFQMEIRHVVLYLGEEKPLMRTQLEEHEIYRGFDLINVHEYDAYKLLNSDTPRQVIMAILANYPKEQTEAIIRLIFRRLRTLSKSPAELEKHIKQLLIFSRLRKINDLTFKISQDMPITYDIQQDYLYNRGIKQGREEGIEKGIEQGIEKGTERTLYKTIVNVIQKTDFDDEKIALLIDVSIDFVQKVRQEILNTPLKLKKPRKKH